ncbi:MAG: hypothetical protein JXB29_11095, partial [Sedimentisphaerales bacterium]|nr:hypothetical protein [Sedimentisphaerales bacterium]
MLKKSILLISVVLMLALAGNASASKWWWGNVDSNWFEPNNYSDSAVPTSADGVNMSISDVGTHDALVIVTGQDCDCASMWSYNELNSTTKWSITGGSLTLHESYLLLGSGSASGDSVFEVSGGTVNADYDTRVGRYLSGGNNGTGYLNMTGGTFNTDDLVIGSVSGWYDGKGYINLNGGTINANTLAMEATCILDITEGTLIIDGNAVSTVQGYVDNGWITAY